jgi:DNA-binding response OmpR family regulator
MTNLPVLIVDDSLTVRMDLSEAFERAGFALVACGTVAEARAALASRRFPLVVLDVLLPDGDGVGLLAELRALPGGVETAVVLLSTEAEVSARVRGLKTGADEYVGKPYDAGALVAKACALLHRSPLPGTDAAQATVLVIDDSPTYRHVLCEALEREGYAVVSAASGEEGLRVAARTRPRAIIVDGVMPGIDGATVIRRVRLDVALRGIACIMLTGSEEQGAELRALDAGADAFVRKDEDVSVVLARVAAVLRAAASPSAPAAPSTQGPQKVLVIDEDPAFLDRLAAALRQDGSDVILGRSGAEALELLGIQGVDCILLSADMGGLDGLETCRRIKAAPMMRDVPLLLLTDAQESDAVLAGLAAGADDCIARSIEPGLLKARVRAQIRRKQFEDENRRVRLDLLSRELQETETRAARELAETRARLIEQLERKNDELEAFTHSVSHDLRAPLRGIQGFAAALCDEHLDKLDDDGRHYLTRLRAAAQRMDDLITDMLALSRVQQADLVRGAVDLSRLAAAAAADLQQREPSRAVEVHIAPGMTAHADARLMRIVFDNLLGNAWKFTGGAAHPRVEVGLRAGARPNTYFVRDNGAGFDMRRADRLFRPFQRLHTSAEFTGTGIGLATVARVVDRHGGRVWAESSPGAGATFLFTLEPS